MKQIDTKTEGQTKLTIGTQAGSSRTVGIALSDEMSDLRVRCPSSRCVLSGDYR